MMDAVTILAQRNRLHSQRLYMESITINREDGLLKADLAVCIVYYRSQADTAAETDDLSVISKEADGIFWGILSHKYHQNHQFRNLQLKSEFDHICVFPYAYAPLTFNSIQKYLIFPQGAILLWSWRARKIIIHKLKEQYNKHNTINKRVLL